MKKILLALFTFIFAFSFASTTALAQEEPSDPAMEDTEEEMVATESSTYKLPYPGMLPDNPLYKLKTARNKLMLFMIRNPAKKAEKHLELADKQLIAALKLAEKDKMDLAIHTAFKGEHHMTKLIDELRKIDAQERDIDKGFIDTTQDASDKHVELLMGILERTESDDNSSSIETIIEFSQRNKGEIMETYEKSLLPDDAMMMEENAMMEEEKDEEMEQESDTNENTSE